MLCPKCKTDQARRSHRLGMKERLVSLGGYRPYRCLACKHRFLRIRERPHEPAPPRRGVERESGATRRALRGKRFRRDLLVYASALILFGVVLYFLIREPALGN